MLRILGNAKKQLDGLSEAALARNGEHVMTNVKAAAPAVTEVVGLAQGLVDTLPNGADLVALIDNIKPQLVEIISAVKAFNAQSPEGGRPIVDKVKVLQDTLHSIEAIMLGTAPEKKVSPQEQFVETIKEVMKGIAALGQTARSDTQMATQKAGDNLNELYMAVVVASKPLKSDLDASASNLLNAALRDAFALVKLVVEAANARADPQAVVAATDDVLRSASINLGQKLKDVTDITSAHTTASAAPEAAERKQAVDALANSSSSAAVQKKSNIDAAQLRPIVENVTLLAQQLEAMSKGLDPARDGEMVDFFNELSDNVTAAIGKMHGAHQAWVAEKTNRAKEDALVDAVYDVERITKSYFTIYVRDAALSKLKNAGLGARFSAEGETRELLQSLANVTEACVALVKTMANDVANFSMMYDIAVSARDDFMKKGGDRTGTVARVATELMEICTKCTQEPENTNLDKSLNSTITDMAFVTGEFFKVYSGRKQRDEDEVAARAEMQRQEVALQAAREAREAERLQLVLERQREDKLTREKKQREHDEARRGQERERLAKEMADIEAARKEAEAHAAAEEARAAKMAEEVRAAKEALAAARKRQADAAAAAASMEAQAAAAAEAKKAEEAEAAREAAQKAAADEARAALEAAAEMKRAADEARREAEAEAQRREAEARIAQAVANSPAKLAPTGAAWVNAGGVSIATSASGTVLDEIPLTKAQIFADAVDALIDFRAVKMDAMIHSQFELYDTVAIAKDAINVLHTLSGIPFLAGLTDVVGALTELKGCLSMPSMEIDQIVLQHGPPPKFWVSGVAGVLDSSIVAMSSMQNNIVQRSLSEDGRTKHLTLNSAQGAMRILEQMQNYIDFESRAYSLRLAAHILSSLTQHATPNHAELLRVGASLAAISAELLSSAFFLPQHTTDAASDAVNYVGSLCSLGAVIRRLDSTSLADETLPPMRECIRSIRELAGAVDAVVKGAKVMLKHKQANLLRGACDGVVEVCYQLVGGMPTAPPPTRAALHVSALGDAVTLSLHRLHTSLAGESRESILAAGVDMTGHVATLAAEIDTRQPGEGDKLITQARALEATLRPYTFDKTTKPLLTATSAFVNALAAAVSSAVVEAARADLTAAVAKTKAFVPKTNGPLEALLNKIILLMDTAVPLMGQPRSVAGEPFELSSREVKTTGKVAANVLAGRLQQHTLTVNVRRASYVGVQMANTMRALPTNAAPGSKEVVKAQRQLAAQGVILNGLGDRLLDIVAQAS